MAVNSTLLIRETKVYKLPTLLNNYRYCSETNSKLSHSYFSLGSGAQKLLSFLTFLFEKFQTLKATEKFRSFTDLNEIKIDSSVHDTQGFLDFLKNFNNIVELSFDGGKPQDLFHRLPEQSAVQKLIRCSQRSFELEDKSLE